MILDKNPKDSTSVRNLNIQFIPLIILKVTSFSNIGQLEIFDGQDSSVLIDRIRTLTK
jgi:hypothetical protein